MAVIVLHNNEIPRNLWKEFVEKSSFSTPFQTPEYFDFYNSVQGLSAIAIAIEENKDLVASVVISIQKEKGIKGFFSRRAIIYGGPIIKKGSTRSFSMLLHEISKVLKGKAIYAETRNLNNYSEYKSLFVLERWKYKQYLNFKVACEDETSIWSNLNRLRKRQIKKALQNNVIINEAGNIEDIIELYKILFDIYRNKIKKPLFDDSFFLKLFNTKFCKVFVVKANDKIIGGHFCLVDKNIIYDWYGCGLDKIYNDYAPSTMVVYAALQYGARHNMKYFDFMGAGTPSKVYGVRDFKAQFGGELVEYGRFIKILNPILFWIGESGMKIISKLSR